MVALRGEKSNALKKKIMSSIEREGKLQFILDKDFSSNDTADHVIIISNMLYDLFPSSSLFDLQKELATGNYGINNENRAAGVESYVSDGLEISFERRNDQSVHISIFQETK